MRLMLYGGSFNPPHPAHVRAARLAYEALRPDRLIIMPAADPPHKKLDAASPPPEERLELTRIAFRDFPQAEVSDMEIRRGGASYTADTVRELTRLNTGCSIDLVVGADMLTGFDSCWREAPWLLQNVRLAALSREVGDLPEMQAAAERLRERYGADIVFIDAEALPMSSSEMRKLLQNREGADTLDPEVYARIIKTRAYGAKPNLPWLRERSVKYLKPKRVPHVDGCADEAARLARRWGEDGDDAREAGLLHDITKKLSLDEQLTLAKRLGVEFDALERVSLKLTHAITGAALARELFGVDDRVYGAIRWHTTGRPDMTLLEKIVYLADYIEPTREFDGVDALRSLAYEDIDAAMCLGLDMSLRELTALGTTPHHNTRDALLWYGKEHA